MPHNRSNISVTLLGKGTTASTTTMVSTRKLYEGRSPAEIKTAEKWAKRVCDDIYGK